MSMKRWSFVLTLLLLAAPASAGEPAAADPVGRWAGDIEVVPGSNELTIVLDLERAEDGSLAGTMSIPIFERWRQPIEDLTMIDDRTVSWAYRDDSGVAVLTGEIDGEVMRGHDLEGGERYPFTLHRVGPPGADYRPQPELSDLADVAAFRERFNRDADSPRLLLVLGPSCGLCRGGARMVERHVLGRYADADLPTYVVWVPIAGQDDRAAAEAATSHLVDPRASHFWMADTALPDALRSAVGLAADGPTAWDVYLVYPAGIRWEDGEPAPAPALWMHRQGKPLPRELVLDARVMAERMEEVMR